MKLPDIPYYASISRVVDFITANWIFAVVALAVYILLFLGIFKGFKHTIRILIIFLVLGVIAGVVFIVLYILNQDWLGLTLFLIAWFPTILFGLILLFRTLLGLMRGLHKSVTLLKHAIILGAIFFSLFLFFSLAPMADELIVVIANLILGEGGIQDLLNVSSSCASLREILLEFLMDNVGDSDIGLILIADTPYLLAIINMAYRMVFALIFYILYVIFKFLLYLIYLIFYPERRYKKKINRKFIENKVDKAYHKNRIGGGCIGLIRGTLVGVMVLSLIGSMLFMVTGGTIGQSKLPEMNFETEEYNLGYTIYRSVDNYGAQGIYSVLNAVRDPNDTPYYLYAADLVFSGGYDDEELEVKGTFKFRETIGELVGFGKNTITLMLKYGGSDIQNILDNGTNDSSMEVILEVMSDPGFREEFNELIRNFDGRFLISLLVSTLNAVIDNIEELSYTADLDDTTKDIVQVMFKKGYLSSIIPDERDMKAAGKTPDKPHPYLHIGKLINKEDIINMMDVVFAFLANEIDVEDPSSIITGLLPRIESLSLFSEERSKEVSPVLGRLYCIIENMFLTEEGEDGVTYAEIAQEDIDWTAEIRSLLDIVTDVVDFISGLDIGEDSDTLSAITELFDENNPEYEKNLALYDRLANTIINSRMIDRVLRSSMMSGIITNMFTSISENVYIPATLHYANTYDQSGNIVEYGEMFYLLYGVRHIATGCGMELVKSLTGGDADFATILDKLADSLEKQDSYGLTLTGYLTDSVLLRSLISSLIIENAGDAIAVPTASFDKDEEGNTVQLINKAELKQIFDALPRLAKLIAPFIDGEVTAENVTAIVQSDVLHDLLHGGNKIIEGTIANLLINMFGENGMLVIPRSLQNFENWVTTEQEGEVSKLFNVIEMLALDIGKVVEGGFEIESLIETLKSFDREKLTTIFSSQVIHYTISDILEGGELTSNSLSIIVPYSCTQRLENDVLTRLISVDELVSLILVINELNLDVITSENLLSTLIQKNNLLTDSAIISASIINFIASDSSVVSSLNMPEKFITAGKGEEIKSYSADNVWRKELPALINAIDEIFNISGGDSFSLEGSEFNDKVSNLLQNLSAPSITDSERTKLEVCCDSEILKNEITVELDKALKDFVKPATLAEAKVDGYYTTEELCALSDAARIFDIDYTDSNVNFTDRINEEIMNLNNPRDDFNGETTLDVIFRSAIIRSVMTEKIDEALNGANQTDESLIEISVRDSVKVNGQYPKSECSALVHVLNDVLGITDINNINTNSFTDISKYSSRIDEICESGICEGIITKQLDDNLTADMIEPDVKSMIKRGSKLYPRAQIKALFTALEELNLTSMESFGSFEFATRKDAFLHTSTTDSERTQLDVLYDSDIVTGIITNSVKKTMNENDGLSYTRKAERTDLPVLKKGEIESLLTLLGTVALDQCSIGSLNISGFGELVKPDNSGNPASFLVLASLSENLISNADIIVTSTVCDDNMIKAEDAYSFIQALDALNGTGSVNSWEAGSDDLRLPDEAQCAALVQSAIMRATFSRAILLNNTGVVFAESSISFEQRMTATAGSERVAVISKTQLELLFEIIRTLSTNDDFDIITFHDITDLAAVRDNIDILYAFDVTRYRISEVIDNTPALVLTLMGVTITDSDKEFDSALKFNDNSATQASSASPVVIYKDKIQEIADKSASYGV